MTNYTKPLSAKQVLARLKQFKGDTFDVDHTFNGRRETLRGVPKSYVEKMVTDDRYVIYQIIKVKPVSVNTVRSMGRLD